MSKPRVLLICHNHPDLVVGGVEVYVRDLYQALEGRALRAGAARARRSAFLEDERVSRGPAQRR